MSEPIRVDLALERKRSIERQEGERERAKVERRRPVLARVRFSDRAEEQFRQAFGPREMTW